MSGLTPNTDHTCTITASNMYGQIKNFRAKKIFRTLEGPPSKPTNVNVTGKTGFTHSMAGSPLWSGKILSTVCFYFSSNTWIIDCQLDAITNCQWRIGGLQCDVVCRKLQLPSCGNQRPWSGVHPHAEKSRWAYPRHKLWCLGQGENKVSPADKFGHQVSPHLSPASAFAGGSDHAEIFEASLVAHRNSYWGSTPGLCDREPNWRF